MHKCSTSLFLLWIWFKTCSRRIRLGFDAKHVWFNVLLDSNKNTRNSTSRNTKHWNRPRLDFGVKHSRLSIFPETMKRTSMSKIKTFGSAAIGVRCETFSIQSFSWCDNRKAQSISREFKQMKRYHLNLGWNIFWCVEMKAMLYHILYCLQTAILYVLNSHRNIAP